MAEKRGRKSLYYTHVKPFFEQIDKMLNNGASEEQVADALNVSYSSFNNYKRQYKELADLCNKPRVNLVEDLRSALVKRALGFKYEEKRQYITRDADGNEKKHTEIITREALPDTTAIFGALNLYDETYVKDKKAHELKEQELELRKMALEMKDW